MNTLSRFAIAGLMLLPMSLLAQQPAGELAAEFDAGMIKKTDAANALIKEINIDVQRVMEATYKAIIEIGYYQKVISASSNLIESHLDAANKDGIFKGSVYLKTNQSKIYKFVYELSVSGPRSDVQIKSSGNVIDLNDHSDNSIVFDLNNDKLAKTVGGLLQQNMHRRANVIVFDPNAIHLNAILSTAFTSKSDVRTLVRAQHTLVGEAEDFIKNLSRVTEGMRQRDSLSLAENIQRSSDLYKEVLSPMLNANLAEPRGAQKQAVYDLLSTLAKKATLDIEKDILTLDYADLSSAAIRSSEKRLIASAKFQSQDRTCDFAIVAGQIRNVGGGHLPAVVGFGSCWVGGKTVHSAPVYVELASIDYLENNSDPSSAPIQRFVKEASCGFFYGDSQYCSGAIQYIYQVLKDN